MTTLTQAVVEYEAEVAALVGAFTSANTVAQSSSVDAEASKVAAQAQASAASVSAAEALVSKNSALASLNEMKGRYYGPLAADPALDPLGAAVTVGDEYFNTTTSIRKVYNGVAWQASEVNAVNLAASSGASLVGHISSFAGSVATTIKAFLDRIISLENGATSHSDGTNTITGSPRWFIGNNMPSSDDSALLIGRGLTGSYVLGAHAIRDETTYTASGTALFAYASYDSIPVFSGAEHYNHLRSFQARPSYGGAGTIDEISGHTHQVTHTGAGTALDVYGYRASKVIGGGPVTINYAFFVDGDFDGGEANYALYSASATVASYHGGLFQFGTAPKISAAGFTGYGAVLTHDASGNLLSNPNFTVINGVQTMAAPVAKIVATTAFALELDSAGIIDALRIVRLPAFTVATLPTPASAFTYSKCFVSDASVSHTAGIGAVVAGGGANKVPVYSDGTNWRIG